MDKDTVINSEFANRKSSLLAGSKYAMDRLILIVIVIGMAVVTYLPRMAPMVILKNIKLPGFLKTFFKFIPYAALGALIIPGIFSSTGDVRSAIVGTIVSVTLALFRLNVMFVVLGGILGVFVAQILF